MNRIVWYVDWQIIVDQIDWLGTGHYLSLGQLEVFSCVDNKIYLIYPPPPIRLCSVLKIPLPSPPHWRSIGSQPSILPLYTLFTMTNHLSIPPWKPYDYSKILHSLPSSILPLYTLLAMTDHSSIPPWKPYDSFKILYSPHPSILPLYTLLAMTDHSSIPLWKPYDYSKILHSPSPVYITPLYSVGNDILSWKPYHLCKILHSPSPQAINNDWSLGCLYRLKGR